MTIDKAIEILTDLLRARRAMAERDVWDAIKLGIGALNQVRGLHDLHYGSPLPPLPGETKE